MSSKMTGRDSKFIISIEESCVLARSNSSCKIGEKAFDQSITQSINKLRKQKITIESINQSTYQTVTKNLSKQSVEKSTDILGKKSDQAINRQVIQTENNNPVNQAIKRWIIPKKKYNLINQPINHRITQAKKIQSIGQSINRFINHKQGSNRAIERNVKAINGSINWSSEHWNQWMEQNY